MLYKGSEEDLSVLSLGDELELMKTGMRMETEIQKGMPVAGGSRILNMNELPVFTPYNIYGSLG